MKKKEKRFLLVLCIILAAAILIIRNPWRKKEPDVVVDIRHSNEIVESFDPYVDATYHIQGSYGTLDVEVKDGKWHVTNEQCPNHICASVGWVGVGEDIPIVCMPNEVIIMERVQNDD